MAPLANQPGEIGFCVFTKVNRVEITLRGEPIPRLLAACGGAPKELRTVRLHHDRLSCFWAATGAAMATTTATSSRISAGGTTQLSLDQQFLLFASAAFGRLAGQGGEGADRDSPIVEHGPNL
jgi:hypothetical protein